MRRTVACLLGLIVAGACRREHSEQVSAVDSAAPAPAPVPALTSTPVPTTSTASFPAAVVRDLAALSDTVTPSAWLRAHPADTLQIYKESFERDADDRWCARAVSRGFANESTAVRYAYFYPPAGPADLSLPPDGANLIREQCRLGAIWLQTSPLGNKTRVAELVRDSLAKLYGAGQQALDNDVVYSGSHYWNTVGSWESDAATVVSAHDEGMPGGTTGPRVLAFASLSAIQFGERASALESGDVEARHVLALTTRAARLAQVDSARAARLLTAYANAVRAYNTDESGARARVQAQAAAKELRTALTDWITSSRSLDGVRRAAAFVAADQVLASSAVRYVLADTTSGVEHAVQALGARFAPDQLGGGNAYVHSWLDSAARSDSGGPAGRLATLAWLQVGFNRGMCAGTDSASQRVSATAEQLLRAPGDSMEMFELHVLAGDGYADIVALAAGKGGEYAEADSFAAAAPEARRRAVQHYRDALRFAPTSGEERAGVWLKAWRLLAGLPPTELRFYCVYD